MEDRKIYEDIALRTQGDIYIGVVGPVRTGKSTFIKRFMETMVIPNIENVYRRERARDELPQSASGRTIMTAEPKFVPEEAVAISVTETSQVQVRLVEWATQEQHSWVANCCRDGDSLQKSPHWRRKCSGLMWL